MRVLVTGHDGYIGSVLVPILRQAGHEVVGLDTGLFADCVLGPAPEEVKTLRVDLRDVEPPTSPGFDAVMHLAALCNDPLGNLNPDLTYDVNHRSTIRLARPRRRRACSGSSSPRRAPSTARAPTTPRWTRRPASRR